MEVRVHLDGFPVPHAIFIDPFQETWVLFNIPWTIPVNKLGVKVNLPPENMNSPSEQTWCESQSSTCKHEQSSEQTWCESQSSTWKHEQSQWTNLVWKSIFHLKTWTVPVNRIGVKVNLPPENMNNPSEQTWCESQSSTWKHEQSQWTNLVWKSIFHLKTWTVPVNKLGCFCVRVLRPTNSLRSYGDGTLV